MKKHMNGLTFALLAMVVVSMGWIDPASATASMDFGGLGGQLGGISLAALAFGGITNSPFPIIPELTAIAIGYKNKRMIADRVMPRVLVGKQEFTYFVYALEDGFTVPDTRVGRTSRPNEAEFSGIKKTESTEDHGLSSPIPQRDVDNAPVGINPLGRAVEKITNLIELDREIRVSSMVFDPLNYAAANKLALAGASMYTDPASTPIKDIRGALDTMLIRANKMTIGRLAFSALQTHPEIVKASHGNAGDKGVAGHQAIAELFELEEINVGEARVNTARKGQPVALQRAWGPHICLHYNNEMADTDEGQASFAITADFGGRRAGSRPDPDIGLDGGQRVQAGESVKELLIAAELGFLITNAA